MNRLHPRTKNRIRNANLRTIRKEQGICVLCGKNEAEKLKTICRSCLDKMSESAKLRRETIRSKICTVCKKNKPERERVKCKSCIESSRHPEVRRMENSSCIYCDSPTDTGSQLCKYHRDMQKRSQKKYTKKLRSEILEAYGRKCVCCGETIEEFLHIDHIKGGGYQHRKSITGTFYKWLKRNKFPTGYQILCANCNLAKGRYGECPHEALRKQQKM